MNKFRGYIFLSFSSLFSQVTFVESDITTNADGAHSVYIADMDNDGDMDIVSASFNDDAITWYENDGANNPSWLMQNISSIADKPYSIFVADINNDGYMDIVSGSINDDMVAWYRNDGRKNPSWTHANVTSNADGVSYVFVADINNDSNLDIISASIYDNSLTWYKNDGAENPSWEPHNITNKIDKPWSVFAGDLDNDGDMDIVSASVYDNTVAWYENDGLDIPSWEFRQIDINAVGASSVFIADLDNDGDMDIVCASQDDNTIAWYENDGGVKPLFNTIDITTNAKGAHSIYVADLDNDGDLDIISASVNDDTIAWYENDGFQDPSFLSKIISTNADGACSVFAGDLDNDGDMDIVSASVHDDAITWYESNYNELLSIRNEIIPTNYNLHENYPNPFNPVTILNFDLPEMSNVKLTIFNIIGQEVKIFKIKNVSPGYHSLKWNSKNKDGDTLSAGIYFYRLEANHFIKTKKMILLK